MSWFSRLFSTGPRRADASFVNPVTTEVHSHLIPGIDDGVQTMDESVEVLRNLAALGYTKVITTPHIMGDFYKNGPFNIVPLLEALQDRLREENIPIRLEAAAEYMIDESFEKKIGTGELLTFGDRYVLVETPFTEEPVNLKSVLFELQINGYRPVLAHPERYAYLALKKDKYRELFEQGVLFQVNLFSLVGYYSPQIRKTAEYLIREKMVNMIGSDCHGLRHLTVLRESLHSYNYQQVCGLPLINNQL